MTKIPLERTSAVRIDLAHHSVVALPRVPTDVLRFLFPAGLEANGNKSLRTQL